jgi:hypothetical protein
MKWRRRWHRRARRGRCIRIGDLVVAFFSENYPGLRLDCGVPMEIAIEPLESTLVLL